MLILSHLAAAYAALPLASFVGLLAGVDTLPLPQGVRSRCQRSRR